MNQHVKTVEAIIIYNTISLQRPSQMAAEQRQ